MADDIERLRAEVADWRLTVQAQEAVAEALRTVVAEKHAEIEALRAAGDELARQSRIAAQMFRAITAYEDDDYQFLIDCDAAVTNWQEVRRG